MSSALIIVDVQNDFLPGGALGVPDGHDIIDPLIQAGKHVDHVLFTRDFHPANHCSFSSQPKFEDGSWPSHCVQGTYGSDIFLPLRHKFMGAPVFSKGVNADKEEYSGWYAVEQNKSNSLPAYLEDKEVSQVLVGGLALDYCVYHTVLDLMVGGYEPTLLLDCTRPVSYLTGARALIELAHYDSLITFLETVDILEEVG